MMDFGICVPHYGKLLDIERIMGLARHAEALGFASVWVTDHILVPRTLLTTLQRARQYRCSRRPTGSLQRGRLAAHRI